MSNLYTIGQSKGFPAGTVLPAIQGMFVAVDPAKAMPSNQPGKPDGVVQGFKFQDGNDFIYGDAWDTQDLTPWINRPVVIRSVKARNNRVAGVSVKDKSGQNGQTYKKLVISKVAVLETPEQFMAMSGQPIPQAIAAAPLQQAPVARPPVVAQPAQAQLVHTPPQQTMQQPPSNGYPTQGYPSNPPPVAMAPQVKAPPAFQGATIGNAITNAINVVLKLDTWNDSTFADSVHFFASEILRVAQRLEAGDLASVDNSARAAVNALANAPMSQAAQNQPPQAQPAAAAPTARPKPGPNNAAFDYTQDDGDSVPF